MWLTHQRPTHRWSFQSRWVPLPADVPVHEWCQHDTTYHLSTWPVPAHLHKEKDQLSPFHVSTISVYLQTFALNMLKPAANDPSLTTLQQTGTMSSPAPTIGLVTEHFLLLLPMPGTVYPPTSRLLPVQRRFQTSLEDLDLQKGLWLIYILSWTLYVMRHRSLHVL